MSLLIVTLIVVVGTLGMFEVRFNWLTSIVPTVLIIVVVCDSMHVINSFTKPPKEASPVEKMQYVYRDITLPCLLTSLTTADVYFFSLINPFSEIFIVSYSSF